jgi:hypothetical protein
VRRAGEQCRGGHDLAGLAVTALDHFQIQPRFLHLGASGRLTDALDGRDRPATHGAHRQHAGAHGLAIQMHGAGTALRYAAAEFRAGQT